MPSKRKQYSAEYRSPAFPGNLVGRASTARGHGSRTWWTSAATPSRWRASAAAAPS